MNEITPGIRKRFVKDNNIPIAIFIDPYFSERLKTIDKVIPCVGKWDMFLREIDGFRNEQEYFEYYNSVKEAAITHLRENAAYQNFIDQEYTRPISVYPKQNIYSPVNDGKYYLSLDMRKANFSSLQHFDSRIFDDKCFWDEWIGQFTTMQHIRESKYIRQVIMGACDPKRQIAYETQLTVSLADAIRDCGAEEKYDAKIVCVSNDEIVYELNSEMSADRFVGKIFDCLSALQYSFFRIEVFRLNRIGAGYRKDYLHSDWSKRDKFEFKCVPAENFHLVVKDYFGEALTENDKVFVYNGMLAKYL